MRTLEIPGNLDAEAFAEKATAIYEQKYREQLEASEHGKVVAIEVESEEAFVGRTALEAAMKARKKFPDKLLYFIRVGYQAVHSMHGPGKRVSITEKA